MNLGLQNPHPQFDSHFVQHRLKFRRVFAGFQLRHLLSGKLYWIHIRSHLFFPVLRSFLLFHNNNTIVPRITTVFLLAFSHISCTTVPQICASPAQTFPASGRTVRFPYALPAPFSGNQDRRNEIRAYSPFRTSFTQRSVFRTDLALHHDTANLLYGHLFRNLSCILEAICFPSHGLQAWSRIYFFRSGNPDKKPVNC